MHRRRHLLRVGRDSLEPQRPRLSSPIVRQSAHLMGERAPSPQLFLLPALPLSRNWQHSPTVSSRKPHPQSSDSLIVRVHPPLNSRTVEIHGSQVSPTRFCPQIKMVLLYRQPPLAQVSSLVLSAQLTAPTSPAVRRSRSLQPLRLCFRTSTPGVAPIPLRATSHSRKPPLLPSSQPPQVQRICSRTVQQWERSLAATDRSLEHSESPALQHSRQPSTLSVLELSKAASSRKHPRLWSASLIVRAHQRRHSPILDQRGCLESQRRFLTHM